ncbi:unnamed protein product [Caenorhabditis auriculariae]|uniref:Potassium channel domain-containing protein n=1 Tax=Caenorhabditis auriculariae TaxID=2777116 RepID=A0A8S1HQD6_9PELO|nr:unnamed protein product [Caenorhabditis auriculariae]
MFKIYQRLKWVYQKFKLSAWMPFVALIAYTILGAHIFMTFEQGPDIQARQDYRNRTSYAMEQVLERMLEVKCHDKMSMANKNMQVDHAKEAILWFLDHLNLNVVIEERTDDTPWTWLGSMFYAGQLYTTIGYGYPTTRTVGGRVASIFYILFGIPIFLIILKDIGSLLSRALRKLYKKLRVSKRKIAQTAPMRRLSIPPIPIFNVKSLDKNDLEAGKDVENATEFDPMKQNALNKKLHADNSFPIPLALTILILWILFSAALFNMWEPEWGFLTSVYFFFVSISTVGLGDIIFSNPDRMIYTFMLILLGLALLSMCFNLIQAALERFLDRLLDEYIEEIEKMAEIVTQDDGLNEQAMPLEFKMTGNLLSLPMKRVTNTTGFISEAKGWMAERIANNLIASRLHGVKEESESEGEEEKEAESEISQGSPYKMAKAHEVTVKDGIPSSRRDSRTSIGSNRAKLSRSHHLRQNRPLLNTIRTLEKIKPSHNDFKSIIFSKFVQSEQLNRLVDESVANSKKAMTTVSCQTDVSSSVEEREKKPFRRMRSIHSTSSFSTNYTNSMVVNDDESLMSAAFCDMKFDFHTETSTPPSIHRQPSSQSVSKLDDEDVVPNLPKLLGPSPKTSGLPPRKLSSQLPAVHETPRKTPRKSITAVDEDFEGISRFWIHDTGDWIYCPFWGQC